MRGTQENVLRGPVGHFQAVNPVAMRMEEGDAEAAGEGNLQSGTEKAEPETTLTKGRARSGETREHQSGLATRSAPTFCISSCDTLPSVDQDGVDEEDCVINIAAREFCCFWNHICSSRRHL